MASKGSNCALVSEVLPLSRCEPNVQTRWLKDVSAFEFFFLLEVGRKSLCCFFHDSLSVCCLDNDSCMYLKICHCYNYIPGISMGPCSAFWQNKHTLTACCQTVERWRNITGWVWASLVSWMWSAGRTNSPRACRVRGQMFKLDLTPPHTDRPPRPPDTVFTLSYDSRPLLEQTVLWVSGWLLWSTEFTVCDLCCFTQATLTFLKKIQILKTEQHWYFCSETGVKVKIYRTILCFFQVSAAYLNIISALKGR